MFSPKLYRLIVVPLTILALAWAVATPASAGGGEGPTGPTVRLTPPTVTLDADGQAIVTTTLECWDAAATDGHVNVSVSLGQQPAGGSAFLEASCAPEPQTLTLTVASVTGHAFHPGRVTGIFEFEVYAANGAGQGIGEIDQVILPVQAGR